MITATKLKAMIATCEENGGSKEETKEAVSEWNGSACVVLIADDGSVLVDGTALTDTELMSWYEYCAGIGKSKKS